MALGVDPGGNQGVHPDDSADFTDLEHQRVGGDECVRSGFERAGRNARASRSSLAMVDTWDLERLVTPRDSTSRSIPRVDTPSR